VSGARRQKRHRKRINGLNFTREMVKIALSEKQISGPDAGESCNAHFDYLVI